MKHALWFLVLLCCAPNAWAKKKETACSEGLKKIVALGPVDAGAFSFQDSDPTSLGALLQNQLKKEIESKGCAVVVIQEPPKESEPPAETPAVSAPAVSPAAEPTTPEPTPPPAETKPPKKMSTAEQMALVKQSQQLMTQMLQMAAKGMSGASGGSGTTFSPVAAQALIRARVSTSEAGVDTGGAASVAGIFVPGADIASFSSKSFHVILDCTLLDPQHGTIADHTTIKTSSSQLGRIAGAEVYYYEDSNDQQRAYDRLFKKGIDKCANWVADHLKGSWEGRVFKVEGAKVFLNAGTSAGVQQGMQFELADIGAVGGQGVTFGSEEQWAGLIEVDEIFNGYSIAHLTVGGPAKIGQVLHLHNVQTH